MKLSLFQRVVPKMSSPPKADPRLASRISIFAFLCSAALFSSPVAALEESGGSRSPLQARSHEHHAADYELTLETPGSATLEKAMSVEVHIFAKNGKKINLKYPARLAVVDADKWELVDGQGRLIAEEGSAPKRASLLGGLRPKKEGRLTLQLKVSFSVCTESQCLMEKVVLSDTIDVTVSN